MSDPRWGFEEGAEWDGVSPAREQPARDTVEQLIGQDPEGAVTVVIGPGGAVLHVRVDPDWRRFVDPRALRHSVLTAANNATMRALAWRVEAGPSPVTGPATDVDISLARSDIRRLLDTVTMELSGIARELPAVADRRVAATSAGRHVSAESLRGQVVDVTVDANWAASARPGEIESELLDVLSMLRRETDQDGIAGRLRSSAITELNALTSDPQLLLRRIGLLPESEES